MTPPLEFKPIPQLRALPLIGSFFDFKNHRLETLVRLVNECGDIGAFNIGPIKLVVPIAPEIVEAVLVKESQKIGRGPFYKMVLAMTGENSVFATEGDSHRRLRAIWAPLFQHKRLVSYVDPMVEFADQFQRRLQDGERLDLSQEMMRLAQRVIEKTIFNRDGGEEAGDIFEAMKAGAEYFAHLLTNFIVAPLSWPTRLNRQVKNARKVLVRRSQALIDEWREQGGTDRGDFLSMLMCARKEDGSPLSHEEIIDHVLTLYNAGHETTAAAFMWVFYFLSQHPEVETKLHEEVDTVLGGRKPEYADLARLPYTLKVVKEAMRKNPVAYVFGRAPTEDIDVSGYRLSKGQFLLISPYAMHHNPKYFPDPERFDPERFSPENEKKLPRCAFLPFGMGPMVCVGQHFAMMELQSMVAHIAQHVRFRVAPGEDVKPTPTLTLRPSSLKMIAQRRIAGSQQEGERLRQLA